MNIRQQLSSDLRQALARDADDAHILPGSEVIPVPN